MVSAAQLAVPRKARREYEKAEDAAQKNNGPKPINVSREL